MSAFSPVALHRPASLPEALANLAAEGPDGAALAGGTWIMRAPIRHEAPKRAYVALSHLPELRGISLSDGLVEIGAGITHAALAEAVAACPDLRVLAEAAGHSANPAIRATATLGGNLCTIGYPAGDLVTALLSLDAEVELARPSGFERLGVDAFLARRATLEPGCILTKVTIERTARRSAHVRLPLRKAGDYPVAIVSLAITLDGRDRVAKARAAIGSVEATPRRWAGLEAALLGRPLDPEWAYRAAETALVEVTGREGVEAPGWYRTRVLPSLVRRAVSPLMAQR